jgi:hypothetical protein
MTSKTREALILDNIPVKALSRFWANVDRSNQTGCWLWIGNKNKGGYGYFDLADLSRDKRSKRLLAHRISGMLFWGVIGDRVLLHTCDNPACVNPFHLKSGSQHENMLDKVLKGRARGGIYYGEEHPHTTLTNTQVLQIRTFFADGNWTVKELAIKFGTSKATIAKIISRVTWKHLPDQNDNFKRSNLVKNKRREAQKIYGNYPFKKNMFCMWKCFLML